MKSLLSGALLVSLWCLGQAAFDEYECDELPCYYDLLLIEGGSLPRMREKCRYKRYSLEDPAVYFCGDACPEYKCGSNPLEMSVDPDKIAQICMCLEKNAIPGHCEVIPCHRELLLTNQNSPRELRRKCGSLGPHERLAVSSHVAPSSIQCRAADADRVVQLTPEEYKPICDCVLASETRRQPASDELLSKKDNFDPIYISVFVNIIVADKDEVEEASEPGRAEEYFKTFLQIFPRAGVHFSIKETRVVVDKDWAAGKDNKAMRQMLHKGDNRNLNVYLIGDLDANEEKVAPIDPKHKVYCTPPFDTQTWRDQKLGDFHQDGCIFARNQVNHWGYPQLYTQIWFGLCTEIKQCERSVTPDQMKDLYHNIARMRYVPMPRRQTSAKDQLMAHEQQQQRCNKLPCYKELIKSVYGQEALHAHCQYHEMVNDPSKSLGVFFRSANPTPSPECGFVAADEWHISWDDYMEVCRCVTGMSITPRWYETNDTFVKAGSDLDTSIIYIDVFLHVVASAADSRVALQFAEVGYLEHWFKCAGVYYWAAGIVFRIQHVGLTINAEWAAGRHSAHMRQTLYMGDSRDLNIYYIDALHLDSSFSPAPANSSSTEVFCTFPYTSWWASLSMGEPEHDGCIATANSAPWLLSSAMQYWIGVQMPVARSCETGGCGPKFEAEDMSMMRRLVAINRFVPRKFKWSRLRLLVAEGTPSHNL